MKRSRSNEAGCGTIGHLNSEALKRLFTGLMVLGFTSALHAQHQNRSLSGIVANRHHEPLRGAVVQAENLDTQYVVSYITGRNGQYSFKQLDGDSDYRISATWHEQHSRIKNLSLFDDSRAKVIDLTIKSGSH